MKIIPPVKLTLISTNVADTTVPAYNATTTYAITNVVSGTGTDGWTHTFESLADANTGNPLTDPTKWLDLGAINRHAAFDTRSSTATTNICQIVFKVSPSEWFDTIAIMKLDSVLDITVRILPSSGDAIFNQFYNLRRDTASWMGYFFDPFDYYQQLIINTMIFYAGSHVEVTLNGPTDTLIGVGVMMAGRGQELGLTQYGASVGIEDFSTKETDEFGDTYLLQRAFADTADIQMVLPTPQVDEVRMRLARVRGQPCLYQLNNSDTGTRLDSLVIFGFYSDFSIDIAYHSQSYCSLNIEALA